MRIQITLIILALAGLSSALLLLDESPNNQLPLSNSPFESNDTPNETQASQSSLPTVIANEAITDDSSKQLKEKEAALLANLPKSLKGTNVNGGFQIDDTGHLIISSHNRDFFEYFLTSLGEEDLDSIIERMKNLISLQLQSPAKEEALTLLDNYIELKRALIDLELQVGTGLDQYGQSNAAQQQARLDMLSNIREQYLGTDAANAFYAESEDFDRYMIAKMDINRNQQLTPEQQAQARVSLMESAPDTIKPQLEEEYQMERMQLDVANLKASGATTEEIYQVRAQVLGEAAAERLQQVDQAQQEWNDRYQSYRSQRQAIEGDGLSAEATEAQIKQLQQQLFDTNEQRRIQALDRINQ